MLDALRVGGVLEHLPVATALLVLGCVVVKAILQAWNAWLAATKRIVGAEIGTHEARHHAGDDEWKQEVRDALRELRKELSDGLRKVHGRLDDHIDKPGGRAPGQ